MSQLVPSAPEMDGPCNGRDAAAKMAVVVEACGNTGYNWFGL